MRELQGVWHKEKGRGIAFSMKDLKANSCSVRKGTQLDKLWLFRGNPGVSRIIYGLGTRKHSWRNLLATVTLKKSFP